MDPKQKLIDLAREATGDTDITVAGDFQPKGTTWKVEGNRILFHHMNDVLDALAQTTTPTLSTRRLSSPIRSDRPAGLDSSLVVFVGGEREFVHHGTCRRSGTGPLRVGRCRRRGR